MTQTVRSLGSCPAPDPNDPDDVSAALEVAQALWSRGDLVESVRWIRRAAEKAAEQDCDARALRLAAIAADVADFLQRQQMADAPRKDFSLTDGSSTGQPRAPRVAPVHAHAYPDPILRDDNELTLVRPDPRLSRPPAPSSGRAARPIGGNGAPLASKDWSDEDLTPARVSSAPPPPSRRKAHWPTSSRSTAPDGSRPAGEPRSPFSSPPVPPPPRSQARVEAVRALAFPTENGEVVVRPWIDGAGVPPNAHEVLIIALDPKLGLFRKF